MKVTIFLSACIAFSLLCGVVFQKTQQTDEAAWLLGTWEHKTPRGSMYETWKKAGTRELYGKSYILKEKDTVVFENIRIVRQNNVLTYNPTVTGQNNNQPVSFPLVLKTGSMLVFENKSHDYPQTISYTRISADSLVAEVSGTEKGIAKRQTFPMKRIK